MGGGGLDTRKTKAQLEQAGTFGPTPSLGEVELTTNGR